MATVKLSAQYNWPQFTDNAGSLLSGGKIYTYEEDSTSIKQTTYTTAEGDVPNPNPIVLDSSGRLPNPIWLVDGQIYNIVVKNNQDQVVTSQNEVEGIVLATTGNIGLSPIYNDQVFRSNDGQILANGKVYTYATNTFTLKQSAYTGNNVGNTVLSSNPITLTAEGTLPSPLYLSVGKKYNIVLTEPNGTTILQSIDPVQPIPAPLPPEPGMMTLTFDTAIANTVYLPLGGFIGVGVAVDAEIDWGDGNTESANTQNIYSHTYDSTEGTRQVTITGTMLAYGYPFNSGENAPLISVDSWNDGLELTNLGYAFFGAVNLTQVPNNIPSTVTLLDVLFFGASTFNQNLNSWNTSNVTSMNQIFDGATSFNGNITNWNTSNVTNMVGMFSSATSFNQNISSWNTGEVTSMEIMFFNATAFNQNLSGWNVANVINHVDFATGATSWVLPQPNFPS